MMPPCHPKRVLIAGAHGPVMIDSGEVIAASAASDGLGIRLRERSELLLVECTAKEAARVVRELARAPMVPITVDNLP